MLKDIPSPEYSDADALDLWRVRVLEKATQLARECFNLNIRSLALGFFLGLNFDQARAQRLALYVYKEFIK